MAGGLGVLQRLEQAGHGRPLVGDDGWQQSKEADAMAMQGRSLFIVATLVALPATARAETNGQGGSDEVCATADNGKAGTDEGYSFTKCCPAGYTAHAWIEQGEDGSWSGGGFCSRALPIGGGGIAGGGIGGGAGGGDGAPPPCPAPKVRNGGECECPEGTVEDGGSCRSPTCREQRDECADSADTARAWCTVSAYEDALYHCKVREMLPTGHSVPDNPWRRYWCGFWGTAGAMCMRQWLDGVFTCEPSVISAGVSIGVVSLGGESNTSSDPYDPYEGLYKACEDDWLAAVLSCDRKARACRRAAAMRSSRGVR